MFFSKRKYKRVLLPESSSIEEDLTNMYLNNIKEKRKQKLRKFESPDNINNFRDTSVPCSSAQTFKEYEFFLFF